MEEINLKIQELLRVSDEPVDYRADDSAPNSIIGKYNRQNALMDELIALARKHNTLYGRIIRFQHADSHAVYVITKVNPRTVQLTWVRYMDEWVDDRVGYKGTVSRSLAQSRCDWDDGWDKMVAEKKGGAV